jgi:hypothetical protein
MTLYNDQFDDETISGCWTESYTSPGSGVEFTLSASGTVSGTDFTCLRLYSGEGQITGSSLDGSGIYQSTVGDFDIAIKISPTTPTYSYNPQYYSGIAVKIDNDNYLYILNSHESFKYGYKYNYGGSGASQSLSCGFVALPPYYIRISRVGDIFTPYWCEIGSDEYGQVWLEGPSTTLQSGTCQVWLLATHLLGEDQCYIDFEYFVTVS